MQENKIVKHNYNDINNYKENYYSPDFVGYTEDFDVASIFRRLFISLKRLYWVMAGIVVAFAAVTFVFCKVTYKPMYKCSTSFTVSPLVASDSSNGVSVYQFNYNSTLASQMATTFPYVLQSNVLIDVIESDMGRPINGTITAEAVSTTNIFELTVTSDSADDAFEIINTLVKDYPKVAESILGDTRLSVIHPATKPAQAYNAKDYLKYVGFAALIGLFIGLLTIWIYTFKRKTVISKQDVRFKLNQDYLCDLPFVQSKRSKGKNKSQKVLFKNQSYIESLKILKKRIKKEIDGSNTKVIGIASTTANEGKTSLSYNFAKVMAADDKKVLLIDMDAGNHMAAAVKDKARSINFKISDVVSEKVNVKDIVVNDIIKDVDVLFARSENGKFNKNEHGELFDLVRGSYDYIIVDIPPCSTAVESASIADLCDAYIYVVRCDYASAERIRNSINYISFSRAKNLGVLINGVSSEYVSYGRYGQGGKYGGYGHYKKYGYGYGRYYSYYGNDQKDQDI